MKWKYALGIVMFFLATVNKGFSQPCDTLVTNGGFGCDSLGGISEFAQGLVPGWSQAWGSPEVSNAFATPDPTTYAKFWCMNTTSEAIMTPVAITSGNQYVLKFWYQRGFEEVNPVDFLNFHLFNLAGSGLPSPGILIPAGQNIVTITNISSTNWVEATYCFTANANFTDLLIYSQNLDPLSGWIYLDNIRIFPIELDVPDYALDCISPTEIQPNCWLTSDIATYSWTPSTGLSNANIANPILSPTVDINYSISMNIAACGITLNDNSYVDVGSLIPPTVDLGSDLLLCDGFIKLDAGDGFANYDWTLPGVCIYGGQFAQTCVSGTYCVTVTNDFGCTAYDCVDVIISSSPSVTATASELEPCPGDTVLLGALSSCTNCTYLWSNGAPTPGTTVNPTVTTTYTVTITNPDGCTAISSITITPKICGADPLCKMIENVGNNDIGEAVIATIDGGCAIAGTMFDPPHSGDRDMYFVKYDSDLEQTTVIAKRVGGIYADEGYSVVHRPGDGYYIAGTAIISPTEHNIYVAKLREDGSQIWGYMYGTDNNRIEAARKIIDMSNPNEDALMIVGFTNSNSATASHFDVLALKIRTNGVIMAQNTFGSPSYFDDFGYDVARYDKDAYNNEYFIVGERSLGSSQDAIVIKVNQSLTYIDSEIINNFGRREVAHTVAVLSKANGTDVFIAGSITNTNNGLRDLYIFKLKTDLTQGANPSHVIFGNTSSISYEVAYKMKITKDYKLIIAGENGDNTASGFDGLVLKVDPATLNIDWASTTNVQGINEHFRDVVQLNDASYIGTGFFTVNPTDRDILVSRITDQGISCCLYNYDMSKDKIYTASGFLKTVTPDFDRKVYGNVITYYEEDKICTEVNERSYGQVSGSATEAEISIVPNPNAGEFVIALAKNTSTIKKVNIIDISGRVVQTMISEDAMVSKLQISISQFDSGIYFVEIITNTDDRYTSRVVIQK